ncbi:MAG: thioester reductase domain-containing protein [Actinocrinis sp.]
MNEVINPGGLSVAELLAKALPEAADSAPTGSEPASPETTAAHTVSAHDVDRVAAIIIAEAATLLPDAALGPQIDLFDVGGTSLTAVGLVGALADQHGIVLGVDQIFADARPQRLAERWLASQGAEVLAVPAVPADARDAVPAPPRPFPLKTVDPDEDLALILADLAEADRLPWSSSPPLAAPQRILLTGATGFLGGHMLLDLLRHSDAHVYCLVRASSEQEAASRLGSALAGYSLPWSSEVRRRITALPGDLRRPRLGLSDELWDRLADELDSVVSVGAAVDFLRGYPSLRQSNVLGPLTLASLAATGRPKPLHHVSSIAVFNEVGIATMGEDDPVAHIDRLVAGYDKSKWAAEAALRRARDHGLVVTLLRPGGIGGHTRTGAYNPLDLSSGLMSAFTRLRTVPAFRYLNSAPVDWVSRTAVAVICEPSAWGYNYNLAGTPNTLDDVVRDMALGGMNVRVQDWDQWRARTLDRLAAEPVPELEFLTRLLNSATALKLCEATLTGPAVAGERTDAFLAARNLPAATRYDARAQLKTLERLSLDGLARLPDRVDQPYLWFSETMEGRLTAVPLADARNPTVAEVACSLSLTLSIAGMYQLVAQGRIDVRGTLSCSSLHPDPLVVEHGDVQVRPQQGIAERDGLDHPLLRYRLVLGDRDGQRYWLDGVKYARARRDVWRQTRALTVKLGREGEPASLAGEVVVPAGGYLREQIDGIRVDPRLSPREQRAAKLAWLVWFGREMGAGLVRPFARAGAELLDLRSHPVRKGRNQ